MDTLAAGIPQNLSSLLSQLSDSTNDYYMLYDPNTSLFHFSSNAQEIFDFGSTEDMVCTPEIWRDKIYRLDRQRVLMVTDQLIHGTRENYNLNYRVQSQQGKVVWINSRGKAYRDEQGNLQYILGRISKQVVFSVQDEVNRPILSKELNQIYSEGRQGFLLTVGVDDLRRINLKNGREFGDAVIKALAESVFECAPNDRLVFRINGDCFCTVLLGAEESDVERIFETIRADMRQQCTISGGAVSLQMYQVPEGSVLLEYAESAMETAKSTGKARLCFFSPSDYERKLADMELYEELELAVQKDFDGFGLHYQAQIKSETFELFGAEALLRFHSCKYGIVSPLQFIPLLENSGLIYDVGLWVMRSALRECAKWRTIIPDIHISINMSYVQLCHPEIQADVLQILQESGLPGSVLTIEVTESMELQDYPHLNTIFSAWKKQGIEISVDDFGTGYSSLAWLKKLTIDEIKIDRCFVRDIQHSAYNLRLLSNMIELADTCQIRVCCEGTETAQEIATLEQLRPSIYQGYFFAKPIPAKDFYELCVNWKQYISDLFDEKHDLLRGESVTGQNFSLEPLQLEHALLESTEDMVSICDVDTYEVYYLNPAGQRLLGVRDYRGRKCYKIFRGKDAPCEYCPNMLLRQDSFYVWEDWNKFCDRHFLLRDKLMFVGGKKLRMEVAMDITKKEYLSQATKERLEFSNKIVGYVEILRSHHDYDYTVNQVLASVGDFYKADRAYLFERNPRNSDNWDNTFEWCAVNVKPQKKNLQEVSASAMQRWMEHFEKNRSVLIYNLESLKNEFPLEYDILHRQDIQRLIAVPVIVDGKVVAFIGVDNPYYSIQDDSQIRILAAFLGTKYFM